MRRIDGKYAARTARETDEHGVIQVELINVNTGKAISEDEPVILFRAKDWLARLLISQYRGLCVANKCSPEHIAGVDVELRRFERFAADHPERMKTPD